MLNASKSTTLDWIVQPKGASLQSLALESKPSIRAGESLEYETMERMSPETVALLAGELEAQQTCQKDNTLALEVSWPTKKVILEVLLPDQYRPLEATLDVWRGPSRIQVPRAVEKLTVAFFKRPSFKTMRTLRSSRSDSDYPRAGLCLRIAVDASQSTMVKELPGIIATCGP